MCRGAAPLQEQHLPLQWGAGEINVDIKTQFNINLGNADCLACSPFYLGIDGNAGAQVNFTATLLHELAHGLGFSVLTVSAASGNRVNAAGTAYVASGGLPSVWEQFMYDNTAGKTWLNMSSAERKASAVNSQKLAWTGPNVLAGAGMLRGTPTLKQSSRAFERMTLMPARSRAPAHARRLRSSLAPLSGDVLDQMCATSPRQ